MRDELVTSSDYMKKTFNQLYNEKKPVVVGAEGTWGMHWVTVYGYQNVPIDSYGNPTSLSPEMFLIRDPLGYYSTLAEFFKQYPYFRRTAYTTL